jgi:membrane protease YdiL (CAAX protease family)
MKTIINWKVFWILLAAATIATILLLPYALEVQSSAIDLTKLPIPWPLVLTLQVAQNAILFAIAVFGGLFFAGRVGLGTPILDSVSRGEPVADRVRALLPLSAILGIVTTLVVLGLEIFYGGIAEEILLRLFVMSFLVWLGRFLSKTSDGKPTSAVLWIANILAAVLFGLGHLPTVALLVPLTTIVVMRTVVLNGLIGIVCGWLYWKRGLEAAMISHFSADLVLHVLLAL